MKVLLRLFAFVRPYWWASLTSIALIVAMTSFRMGPAWFTKLVIDQAIPARDWELTLLYVGALVGSAVLSNALQSVETYLEQFVGQRVVFDLRNALYRHLQSQSMSFYDANQTGQLMSRVTNDVGQVQFFLTQGLARLVSILVGIGINVAMLFILDVPLTIVALLVVPLIVYYQRKQRLVMPLFRQIQRLMADLSTVIQENVAGIKLVQAYGREPHEAQRFAQLNHDIRQTRLEISRMMAFIMPGQEFATQVSTVLVLTVGGYRVMEGSMTLGSLVAFQTYALMMWLPIRWLGFVNQMAQQAMAAGERVFEILDTPLDVQEKPGARTLPPLRGRIVFEDVWFSYGKGEPLLRGVSFTAEPGQTIALVGPSGSGKSTITNLIPRFYDVTQGRILVDDVDIRDVTLESLRSQIGMVMQETFLFNMTIRENISYGRLNATMEEVIQAAKAAHAHDFIVELPDGYDTVIGERGVRLSGGQRQRIAIARALLVNPRILILDEATSSVDTRTDYLIQQALDALMRGRTTLVIAHRLSTVQRADCILVVEHGKIVARGTHEELLRTSPVYQRLYEIQFQLQRDDRLLAVPVGAGADGHLPTDGGIHRPADGSFHRGGPDGGLVPDGQRQRASDRLPRNGGDAR